MTLFVTIGFSQYSFGAILCQGTSSKNQPVVLEVKTTGKKDQAGFVLVDVKWKNQKLAGCQGAILAGVQGNVMSTDLSGDLYLECDGDGDAGFMNLKAQGNGNYKALFMAPNGNSVMDLEDEEEVTLMCVTQSK